MVRDRWMEIQIGVYVEARRPIHGYYHWWKCVETQKAPTVRRRLCLPIYPNGDCGLGIFSSRYGMVGNKCGRRPANVG